MRGAVSLSRRAAARARGAAAVFTARSQAFSAATINKVHSNPLNLPPSPPHCTPPNPEPNPAPPTQPLPVPTLSAPLQ